MSYGFSPTKWPLTKLTWGGNRAMARAMAMEEDHLPWYSMIFHQKTTRKPGWDHGKTMVFTNCHGKNQENIGIGGVPPLSDQPRCWDLAHAEPGPSDPAASWLRCQHICRRATSASDQTRCRTMHIMHPPLSLSLYYMYIYIYAYIILIYILYRCFSQL